MRPKFVFSIGEVAIKQGVSQALAGCPLVLMPWTYPDLINEYLQDLWTGNWHSAYGVDNSPLLTDYVFPRKRYRPQPSTIRETANRLANFLHWCNEPRMHHGRGTLNPLAVAERDIDRYGDQMESGLWSSDRKALSASTIGQRQIAVVQFVQWARARGYAAAADFTARTVRRNVGSASGGRRTTLCRRYLVVRRSQPGAIRFPTEAEVRNAINAAKDAAVEIGIRLVFFCGLRADEVCRLTIKDVTNGKHSAGGQRFISVLGKGRKRRTVEADTDLMDAINDYIDTERSIRLHRHSMKSDVLLINDNTGKPYAYRTFWKGFRDGAGAISPHVGRHWYAVMYLLRAWKREQARAARNGLSISTDMMRSLLSLCARLAESARHSTYAQFEGKRLKTPLDVTPSRPALRLRWAAFGNALDASRIQRKVR
jgi:integrase